MDINWIYYKIKERVLQPHFFSSGFQSSHYKCPNTAFLEIAMIGCLITTDGSTCKPEWSLDQPDLQKMACIYLPKQKLYVKITYCDHHNKNVKHPDLRIIKS